MAALKLTENSPAVYTNYGSDCVDVSAPGTNIYSSLYTNNAIPSLSSKYGYLSGTSMATPIVAGVAGLCKSIVPTAIVGNIVNYITNHTDSLEGTKNISEANLGDGKINADKAVEAAIESLNPSAPDITAYHNSKKKKEITKKTRTKDSNPYFTWKEPNALYDIEGYYVYWGTEKKNPINYGDWQTKRNFSPAGVHGNEKSYRLRIKAKDTQGNTSEVGTFKYISDTKIETPEINSLTQVDTGIEIKIKKQSGEHIVGYYVYRAKDNESSYSAITSMITDREFIDTSVEAGHTYKYKVKAIDDIDNESDRSDSSSITI